jgi:predicted MFS family arabinose efflux permease
VILALVPDPPKDASRSRSGSYFTILRLRPLWPLLPLVAMNYTVIGLSGLWIGPFLKDRYGLDATQIGTAALMLGLAMIAGNFCYGPADRLFGSRKVPALVGNLCCAAALAALALWPAAPLAAAVGFLMAALFFGASYPLVMAHARAFGPPQLAGRTVGLLNFFSIGGAGAMQYASGVLHAATPSWTALFLFFALPLAAACAVYTLGRDNLG